MTSEIEQALFAESLVEIECMDGAKFKLVN